MFDSLWTLTFCRHSDPVQVASELLGDVCLPSGWQSHHHNHCGRVTELRHRGWGEDKHTVTESMNIWMLLMFKLWRVIVANVTHRSAEEHQPCVQIVRFNPVSVSEAQSCRTCVVHVPAEVIFIRTENKRSKEQLKCLIEQTIVESHPAYLPVFGSMSRHRKLSKHPQAKSNQQKEFKTMK